MLKATMIQDLDHGNIYAHLSLRLELFLLCIDFSG